MSNHYSRPTKADHVGFLDGISSNLGLYRVRIVPTAAVLSEIKSRNKCLGSKTDTHLYAATMTSLQIVNVIPHSPS